MTDFVKCPSCGREVVRGYRRCPDCRRILLKLPGESRATTTTVPRSRASVGGVWLAIGVVIAVLLMVGSLIPGDSGIAVGSHVTIANRRAQFAEDDQSFATLVDAQNAGNPTARLDARTFGEAAGCRLVVLRRSMGASFVRVIEGLHPGREGWIQDELLQVLTEGSP